MPIISTLLLAAALALGAAPAAAIMFEDPIASVVIADADAGTAAFGDFDVDTATDDHRDTPLPLSVSALAAVDDVATAAASAFADIGTLFTDTNTEVFDTDGIANAASFANFNAFFTGTGVPLQLFLEVDHSGDADGGPGSFTSTEVILQVIGPLGAILVDLLEPFGTGDRLAMFAPRLNLADGELASVDLSVFSESTSDGVGFAGSATTVSFRVAEVVSAAVPAPGTLLLLCAAFIGAMLAPGVRRRRCC